MGVGNQASFVERHHLPILLAILALCAVIRLYRLGAPEGYHYDERYHAFTAARMAEGDRRVYDPWAKPPADVSYEWTHPPLGKLAMAAGVLALGDTEHGWRISSVIFGVGVVALAAWLALLLFGPAESLLTAWLLTFEGLVFVQSRIAMIDIHLTFFVLLSLFFYARWHARPESPRDLLLAGLGAGLALATKWSAVYLFVILAVDLARAWIRRGLAPGRNWIAWLALAFVVIPAAVYLGSYAQFFALGYTSSDFVRLQEQMLGYHMRLEATHAYAAGPLEWILDLRPTWFYVSYRPDEIANVYNLGNHVVFYGGLWGAVWCARRLVRHGGWGLSIVLLAYLLLWVPWLLSPRISFFYHYTPAVPFLCILLAVALCGHNRDATSGRVLHASHAATNVAAAAAVWFVVFYPFLAAVYVPKPLVDLLYLLVLPRPV